MRDLNDDVRYLGRVLGDALRDAGGAGLFDDVEAMRTACKQARESNSDYERVDQIVERLSAERAVDVARAFTIYFRLVNLAEDVHRARVLRERERKRDQRGPVAESFGEIVGGLRKAGVSRAETIEAVRATHVQCVFTAHPTEARRRTTERLLVSVRRCLEEWDRTNPTAAEARVLDRQIRAAVEALWQHAPGRSTKPEVIEEVKAGLWYFDNIIFEAAPRMHRRFVAELNAAYPDQPAIEPLDVDLMLSFGSWMGGDRDGNPYVDEVVTERTLHLQRQSAVRRYERDLAILVDHLAADSSRLATFTKLDATLARSERAVPEIAAAANARNPREPLRRLLTFMRERLKRAARFAPGGYEDGEAFAQDLHVVHDVLKKSGGLGLADAHLTDLIIRVRMFGFYLAQVDVREDARIHRKVVGRWLGDDAYPDRTPAERLKLLEAHGLTDEAIEGADDDLCARQHALLSSLPKQSARYGSRALHTYIISQCESATDVLEVLHMLRWAGVDHRFDIVPLFESRTALAALPETLENLLQNESYREHLSHRGRCQEVLLGYSDSMKEAGIMASRIDLLEAQLAATRVCKKHDVSLRFFHGRGGSVSRGGGPTHRAIQALPASAFSGQMRITEQGETRSFHFGHPELATRYLEQMLGAAMSKSVASRQASGGHSVDKHEIFETLARKSEAAYRALVESDDLVTYFKSCSPAPWLGSLNIGSRPSRRKSGSGLEGLRAIPWVFSWSQNRHVITGWYGAGTALGEFDVAELRELLAQSPFFADMLDNIQMTLAKADLRIGARYAALAPSEHVRNAIFVPIEKEFAVTVERILAIRNQGELLEHDPIIANSIALRNPYVDPLSFLQVRALKQLSSEDSGPEQDHWEKVCRITIQGIAAGLRNTG